MDGKKMRRTLLAAIGGLSIFPLFKLAFFTRKKQVISCGPLPVTRKMLTEDGRLVEVDVARISSGGRKISKEELQGWVKGK